MQQAYFFRLVVFLGLLGLVPAARAQHVGIGTSSPTQTLDVNGTLRVRAAAGSGAGRLLGVADDGTLQPTAGAFGATATTAQPAQAVGQGVNTGGYGPTAVAVNQAGTRAYVLNASRTIQVFDLSGARAAALGSPVSTGSLIPLSIAVNPAGTRAYVVGSGGLQVFDISREPITSLSTSTLAGNIVSIALNPAGTRAYLVNQTDGTLRLALLDQGSSIALAKPVTTGGKSPQSVAVSPAGTRAYVVHSGSNTLQEFDVSGQSITVVGKPTITDDGPQSVAINPAGTRAYVVNSGSGTLQAFDVSGSLLALGKPVDTGGKSLSNIVITPDGAHAYTVDYGNNTLLEFDVSAAQAAATGNPVATEYNPLYIALNPTATRAYVVNSGSNTLQKFNLGTTPRVVVAGYDGSLGSVSLASLGDNLGNHRASQQLVLTGQGLRFSDGTTQTTAPVGDNLGSHTASQNLNLAAYQLVGQGGSQGLAISSSGNVGLGTTTPTARLDVSGNQNLTGTLQLNTGDQDKLLLTSQGAAGSKLGHAAGWGLLSYAGPGSGSQGYHAWLLSGATAYQEGMRLTTTGLGIGTNDPQRTLDVIGSIRQTTYNSGTGLLTLSANQSTYYDWNHNLCYQPTVLVSVDQTGGRAGENVGVSYEHLSSSTVRFWLRNRDASSASFRLRWIRVD